MEGGGKQVYLKVKGNLQKFASASQRQRRGNKTLQPVDTTKHFG